MLLLMDTGQPLASPPRFLVLGGDGAIANTIAAVVCTNGCEIVACQDLLLAQSATNLSHFDVVFFLLDDTSERGEEELVSVDAVFDHNPFATVVVLASEADTRFKIAARRRGVFAVLTSFRLHKELLPLCASLGLCLDPRGPIRIETAQATVPSPHLSSRHTDRPACGGN